jgi:muconolactone delta-isomerase
MLFLVELDHVKSAAPATPEAGRAFIERVIFPTLARAQALVSEGKIVSGGPVAGRIALRLMVEAESVESVDRIVSGLPLWPTAETRITPLVSFEQRKAHVEALLERLQSGGA